MQKYLYALPAGLGLLYIIWNFTPCIWWSRPIQAY